MTVGGKECDPDHPCPDGYICVPVGPTEEESYCHPESSDGGIECQSNRECDDSNACTADFCLYNLCQHSDFSDGLNCDDDNPCTSLDRCWSGVCSGTERDCSAFDGVCTVGICDPESSSCLPAPREGEIECDDGLYCTVEDHCSGGKCRGSARTCDDEDSCTRDACDEGEDNCEHLAEPHPGQEGILVDGTCDNQVDDDCDGLTDDADPNCISCNEDVQCDDSNPCTTDTCTGEVCTNASVADGTACEDGLFCTVDDECSAGVCSGDHRDCSDELHACHFGYCSESSRSCKLQPEPDGTSCDDDEYCTVADECFDGSCNGIYRDCEDGDFCTVDTCNEALLTCEHELVPLPGAEGPPGDPNCMNGIDDDCDGLTDDQDQSCI